MSLTLLLIATMTIAATETTDLLTARIICTNSKLCTDVSKAYWMAKRRGLQYRLLTHPRNSNHSRYLDGDLCSNAHDAGFLLDDEALDWPIACVWLGGQEDSGRCSPAPPADVFGYIDRQQWRDRLVNLRTMIGCSKKAVDEARQVAELYFCRDRCVQAGIGYLSSFIILIATLLSVTCVFCAH